MLYSWYFIANSERTTGTVVELVEKESDSDGYRSISYAPSFQFLDTKGQTIIANSGFSNDPPDYQVGETVPVLYLRSAPKRARIDVFVEHWFFPIIFGGLGTCTLLVAIIMLNWPAVATKCRSLFLKNGADAT